MPFLGALDRVSCWQKETRSTRKKAASGVSLVPADASALQTKRHATITDTE